MLPDEEGLDLEQLITLFEEVTAPRLLWAEVRNIVLTGEGRGRFPAAFGDVFIVAIDDLGITYDDSARSDAVIRIAREHGLSAYDALYVELALRQGASLATLDRAMQRAAGSEGVRLALDE